MKRTTEQQSSGGIVDFFEALRVQGNVIGAIMMRELYTRYGRRGLGYVWLILEPALLAVLVVTLRIFIRDRSYGVGIGAVPFVILGYTTFVMFRGMFNRAEGALESNSTLLYHRMVTVFDLLLGRGLLEAAGSLCALVLLMSLATLLEFAYPPVRLLEFIGGFFLLFWFSFACSLLVCAWTYDNSTLQKFVHPVSYILLPLSGAFYIVEWFPTRVQELIAWWPMAGMFELMRYGWFEPAVDTHTHVEYVITCCMVLTFLGLLSIRVVRRKVQLG